MSKGWLKACGESQVTRTWKCPTCGRGLKQIVRFDSDKRDMALSTPLPREWPCGHAGPVDPDAVRPPIVPHPDLNWANAIYHGEETDAKS